MNIKIRIEKNVVSIFLKSKDKILDKTIFPDEHNMSEKLLTSIDKLLRKNKLRPEDVKKMELKADISDSCTTYRIAKSVTESFNWSVRKF